MRSRAVLEILKTYSPDLAIAFKQQTTPTGRAYLETPLKKQLLSSLIHLNQIHGLSRFISPILDHPAFSTPGESLIIDKNEFAAFRTSLVNISELSASLAQILNESLPEQDPHSLSVKLPPTSAFSDFSQTINEIKQAFEPLLLEPEINTTLKIQNLDSGSLWLEIVTESAKGTSLILGLIWSSIEVAKKYREYQSISQKVKALNVDSETMEKVTEASKTRCDEILNSEVEKVERDYFSESIPERKLKIKYSLELVCELIIKGTEVYPALNAPDEFKKEIPDFRNPEKLLSEPQKLLSKENRD